MAENDVVVTENLTSLVEVKALALSVTIFLGHPNLDMMLLIKTQ